jgi:polysaccharide pyruvyl transferase WcaK-like protein
MPTALIVGAFGQGNPGDEALLASAVAAVRARAGWEPLVATAQPGSTSDRLDVATIEATPTATSSAAVRADALVVGGGTVFKELPPSSGRPPGSLLRRGVALTGIFHARRRPVALIGVGASQVRHPANRRLVRSLAHRADLLVLRDPDSAELLADIGVPVPLRVGADLSWLTSSAPAPRQARAMAPLGVAVSHLAGDVGFFDRLTAALAQVVRAGRPVELEPWQGSPMLGEDAQIAGRLGRALAHGVTVVAPPEDLAEATDRMADRSAVVAMRFHAAVAAADAGTPFVAVAHEPKLAAIARRVGQPTIDVSDPAPVMAASIERALLGTPPAPHAVAEERRRAEATADLLGLVLSGEGDVSSLSDLDLVPEPMPA